jgi:putative oligomerization/nucleic acid binding protein
MPGLLRGIARTAAIAGTATAVSNNVSRRQQARWANQGPAEPQEAYAPPPPAPPAPAPAAAAPDLVSQLKELAALKEQGVLTDAEFAAQKARLLA